MRKTVLFTLMLSFFTTFCIGQGNPTNLILKSGPKLDVSHNEFISEIAGHDESGFYVAKERWTGKGKKHTVVYIEHYNHEMMLTKSVKAELETKASERQFSNLVHFNESLYLFSFEADKKLKKNILYVQTVDKATLTINNDILLVNEIEIGETEIDHPKLYHTFVSRDSSKLLMISTSLGYKDEIMKYDFVVFDSKMNILWDKKVIPESLNAILEFEDLELDNDGNIHILELHLNDRKDIRKRGRPNYKYRLASYYEKGTKLLEYIPNVEGKFLCDLKMSLLKSGELLFGGLYSGETSFDTEGTVYFKMNPLTLEINSKKVNEIGKEFFAFVLTGEHERVAAEFKLERLYDYYLDQLIINEDGGVILVCEQYYYYIYPVYHVTNGKTTSITYEPRFKFRDIALINISNDGKNDWKEKISKTQFAGSYTLKMMSHFTSVINNQIFLIYNENSANLRIKNTIKGKVEEMPEDFCRSENGTPIVVKISNEGSLLKGIVKETNEKDFAICTNMTYKISSIERIGLAIRGDSYRFVKYATKD